MDTNGHETTSYGAGTERSAQSARTLRRSRDDRWLGGVCAGAARYIGVDVTIVRALTVASLLLPGPQVLLYVLLWVVIPQD